MNGGQFPTVIRFNYESIKSAALAEQMQSAADRIRRRNIAAFIEGGRDLIAIKDRIEHGKFAVWPRAKGTRATESGGGGPALMKEKDEPASGFQMKNTLQSHQQRERRLAREIKQHDEEEAQRRAESYAVATLLAD
jgi:hypothetical protein